jgi:hypothetical protein
MTDSTGPTLTAARDVVYPNVDSLYTGPSRAVHLFINETAQTLTFRRSAQPGVVVPAGQARLVRHNGTDIVPVYASELFEPDVISPAQLTANTDNYNPTGLATARTLRLSTDASRNLTGIVPPGPGAVRRILNVGAQDLVLINDATSTAANRFLLGANVTLGADEGCDLWYDTASSRWRMSGKHV